MLSRTADHLFWMSRYSERAGDMPQAFAGMTHQLRVALVRSSPKHAKRASAFGV
ncbi:MAG: alpha-E domain-containing protein [Polaromonas sp.]|uniref:alpha-E domain-containing protein n=1 Tax=Polaromonas sp. TaxID=1869339 RepID=UPI0017A7EE99|nr:alpha-E domain-containing protein [Polaromonas sp.]MBA3592706.1 alpha-E domain-containing protein [Polaromonas sp.]